MQQIVEDTSMIAYAVLMWAIAALFLLFGLLIYHGKTGLIHEYHRERVRSEDMAAYAGVLATAKEHHRWPCNPRPLTAQKHGSRLMPC